MAWMQNGEWLWHLIHTDTFANTKPTFGVLETSVKAAFMATSFGSNIFDNATGPPQK